MYPVQLFLIMLPRQKNQRLDHIPAIELNISCPNVKEGGMAFGTVVFRRLK